MIRVRRCGDTLVELLVAACFLSVSLAPLFYLFNLTKRINPLSEMEFTATLLAQHAMEKIVCLCAANPEALPPITAEEPVVTSPDAPQRVSEYFREILGKTDGLQKDDIPALYWALQSYRCQVDTYYIEDNLYKVIVYIFYEEAGQTKRVFLERLISRTPHPASPTALLSGEEAGSYLGAPGSDQFQEGNTFGSTGTVIADPSQESFPTAASATEGSQ